MKTSSFKKTLVFIITHLFLFQVKHNSSAPSELEDSRRNSYSDIYIDQSNADFNNNIDKFRKNPECPPEELLQKENDLIIKDSESMLDSESPTQSSEQSYDIKQPKGTISEFSNLQLDYEIPQPKASSSFVQNSFLVPNESTPVSDRRKVNVSIPNFPFFQGTMPIPPHIGQRLASILMKKPANTMNQSPATLSQNNPNAQNFKMNPLMSQNLLQQSPLAMNMLNQQNQASLLRMPSFPGDIRQLLIRNNMAPGMGMVNMFNNRLQNPLSQFGSQASLNGLQPNPLSQFGSPASLNGLQPNPLSQFGSPASLNGLQPNPLSQFGSPASLNRLQPNPLSQFGSPVSLNGFPKNFAQNASFGGFQQPLRNNGLQFSRFPGLQMNQNLGTLNGNNFLGLKGNTNPNFANNNNLNNNGINNQQLNNKQFTANLTKTQELFNSFNPAGNQNLLNQINQNILLRNLINQNMLANSGRNTPLSLQQLLANKQNSGPDFGIPLQFRTNLSGPIFQDNTINPNLLTGNFNILPNHISGLAQISPTINNLNGQINPSLLLSNQGLNRLIPNNVLGGPTGFGNGNSPLLGIRNSQALNSIESLRNFLLTNRSFEILPGGVFSGTHPQINLVEPPEINDPVLL